MIGLFIGSFNPPTKAHIEIGNLILKQKLVDRIIYIPVYNEKKLLDLNTRINMLNLVINSNMEVSSIMNNYHYFDYNVLKKLKEKYTNIKIIMGSDLLLKLKDFNNLNQLLEFNYIIVPRFNINILEEINKYYPNYQNHFEILNYSSDISSTNVKNSLEKNINNGLDKKVYDYIIKNNLYKEE